MAYKPASILRLGVGEMDEDMILNSPSHNSEGGSQVRTLTLKHRCKVNEAYIDFMSAKGNLMASGIDA